MDIKLKNILDHVLEELRFRVPEKIILDSLQFVYNPTLFKTEYKKVKYDVDKYFMHLSYTNSRKTIHQLTVEMSSSDATNELQLISAKILLSLQELSKLDSNFILNMEKPEHLEWLAWFYHNEGQVVKMLKPATVQ
jgi:hypothetical protein